MTEGKQYYALGLSVFILPALYLLPKLGWLGGSIAALLGVGFFAGVIFLHRQDPRPLANMAGKTLPGRAVLVLTLLWNLLMLGYVLTLGARLYPTAGETPLPGLLLLLLALWSERQGTKSLIRTGAILFFFLTALCLILFAFGLPRLEGQWLRPVKQIPWRYLPALLAPMPLFYLLGEEKSKPILWLAGGGVLTVLGALFCAGSISPRMVEKLDYPLYDAAKSISVLGVMERVEPLVSAALTGAAFAFLAMVCAVNGKILRQFFPKEKFCTPAANFFLGGGAYWLIPSLPSWLLPLGTTIFWGFLPVAILMVEITKKYKKIEKRC